MPFKQIAKAVLGSTMSGPEGFVVDTVAKLAFSGKTPKSSTRPPTTAKTPPIPGQVRRVPNTMETRVRGAGEPAPSFPQNASIDNLNAKHLAKLSGVKSPGPRLGVAQTQLRLA